MSKNFTYEEFNKITSVFSTEEELLSSAVFDYFISNFAQSINHQNNEVFLQKMNSFIEELEKNTLLAKQTQNGNELNLKTSEQVVLMIAKDLKTPEQKEILLKSVMGFYKFKAQKATEFLLSKMKK